MSSPSSIIPAKTTLAFLLSQVGAHVAAKFAERLEPLKVSPAHSGILRVINNEHGISQQKLAKILGIFPSRLVLLLDELQHIGLIERTPSSSDRRRSALCITARGLEKLQAIGRVAEKHQGSLCGSLNTKETATLTQLLSRIAQEQGLTPGIHPGYKQLKLLKK